MKEDNFFCPICKGLGFIFTPKGVKKCKCSDKKFNLNRYLNIPKRFENASLYGIGHYLSKLGVSLVREYLGKFEEYYKSGVGLLFVGPPGVGKTYTAIALIKYLYLKYKVQGLFIDTKELSVKLKAGFADNRYHQIINALLKMPILLLDDLGNEELTDWYREILVSILSYRYNQKKVTFITTNYYPSFLLKATQNISYKEGVKVVKGQKVAMEDIIPKEVNEELLLDNRLGSHIISRLAEMTIAIPMSGKDKRVKKVVV